MSYGTELNYQYRCGSLRGQNSESAKPADLPVQQATKFEFVINLKAAQQIGLTIPVNVLERANKMIK
jgi:putative ABC transport system substrate-binding protein